jgi:FkbM family methyltransferase
MVRWLRRVKRWLLARLPKDWQLRLHWRQARRKTVVEPEIFVLRRWARKGGIAVDAGANNGVFAACLAQWFERVEAFEPNAAVIEPARRYGPGTIRFHAYGLSSCSAEMTLNIPVDANGVVLAGWGTLEDHATDLTGQTTSVAVQVRPLDEFDLTDVAVIKIDVEGHEKQVLQGARATIERCRPVVLCETQVANRQWLREFAAALGYEVWWLAGEQMMRAEDGSRPAGDEVFNLFLIPEGTKVGDE